MATALVNTANVTPALNQPKQVITSPTKQWDDQQAYNIALGDFRRAESYRTRNHDRRFKASDELWLAWSQRKTWEGTKIPRSSIGVFLALEQCEALLPLVISSLFGDNDLPFGCDPRPNSTVAQARAVRELLRSQLTDLSDSQQYISLREVFRRALKSSHIYGLGPVEFGWQMQSLERIRYIQAQVPRKVHIPHPLTGELTPVSTGQYDLQVFEKSYTQYVNKPLLQNLDIRDCYFDPNGNSPNPNSGSFFCHRSLLSISQIKELEGLPKFNIPNDNQLLALSKMKSITEGDNSKTAQEAYRNNSWIPTVDESVDPANARIEVIRYWQKHKMVWIFGRQWIAYNDLNQYDMIPVLNAFYLDVPGRTYGLSLCDIVEGDQRLAEALVNARIDELNLIIHAPIIRKRGSMEPQAMKKMRPGIEWLVDGDPSKDIIRMEMGNVTSESYIEMDALERRVQRYTGVTDLAALGTPSAGGNSANRTAKGVSTQSEATGKRIQYQVENIEDQFMVPLLNILLALNKKFLRRDQEIEILGAQGQLLQLQPVDILNADVRFSMKASSKMKARQSMLAGGLGLILQTYMNPQTMMLMAQQGYALNMSEIDATLCDTFNLSDKQFWTQNPQQAQQAIQNNPAVMKMMMTHQLQQERLGSQEKIHDEKNETALLKMIYQELLANSSTLREAMTGFIEPKELPSAAGE